MNNPMSCDDRLWQAFMEYFMKKYALPSMPASGWEIEYTTFMSGSAAGIRLGGAIMANAMAQVIK